jgi:hypothetical protein
MPYVITTSNQACYDGIKHLRPLPGSISRRAVATLAELVRELNATGAERKLDGPNGEQGGTVGPLPDGTIITVEPIAWNRLVAEPHRFTDPQIIAAFNAAQD